MLLLQSPLFIFNRGSGSFWFNSSLVTKRSELQIAYWLVGWLMGQALHNRAQLGQPFAVLLFRRLLLGDAFEVGGGLGWHWDNNPGFRD
jgi:hypothetical protein